MIGLLTLACRHCWFQEFEPNTARILDTSALVLKCPRQFGSNLKVRSFHVLFPRWVMRAACLRKVHPKKKQNFVNILTKFLRNL